MKIEQFRFDKFLFQTMAAVTDAHIAGQRRMTIPEMRAELAAAKRGLTYVELQAEMEQAKRGPPKTLAEALDDLQAAIRASNETA